MVWRAERASLVWETAGNESFSGTNFVKIKDGRTKGYKIDKMRLAKCEYGVVRNVMLAYVAFVRRRMAITIKIEGVSKFGIKYEF